jgi:putative addiction module component (TIGR02574 family)
MAILSQSEIEHLSVVERLDLIGEIWDTLEDSSEVLPITEAQRREIVAIFDRYQREPNSGSSWPDVRQRIIDKHKA